MLGIACVNRLVMLYYGGSSLNGEESPRGVGIVGRPTFTACLHAGQAQGPRIHPYPSHCPYHLRPPCSTPFRGDVWRERDTVGALRLPWGGLHDFWG